MLNCLFFLNVQLFELENVFPMCKVNIDSTFYLRRYEICLFKGTDILLKTDFATFPNPVIYKKNLMFKKNTGIFDR